MKRMNYVTVCEFPYCSIELDIFAWFVELSCFGVEKGGEEIVF